MEGVSSSGEQEFTVTLLQEQICQIQDNYFGGGTSSQTRVDHDVQGQALTQIDSTSYGMAAVAMGDSKEKNDEEGILVTNSSN